ncbi:MAG: dihydroorotate dehydrogenase, partial [Mycoplasmoidaceae bacterium]|nr:dihydroorotate dehydrogenase [Mycoplasmoidaceae bacterium]
MIPASGTFGYGYEFSLFYDINMLGSFSMKGTTCLPRFGNPLPRIAECENSMINSIGLQNPGIDKVISDEFRKLKKVYHKKIVANIAGTTIEEYVELVKKLNDQSIVGIIEVNISCPNVKKGALKFESNPEHLTKLVKALKKVSKKPIFIKLSATVKEIDQMAIAAKKAGADGLCLINTLVGMRIDLNTGKPILANKFGGYSGPAIKPIALRAIYMCKKATGLPIIGMGGVQNAYDVIEMMYAGANAVSVGSQNLINPYACKEIIEDLPRVMEELKINKLTDIIG